ncbi:protein NO VEIN domain-containing protein [Qipengyuania sp. YIM B01966]|uniref:protein NO VEIN domain-containing protein n=1 Tax=Qipengyuania sp. YIM B01966 TaxID=2778646 RepID=UPI0018F6AF0A|nr:DUF3883 domain-containing protein [Qipengyuania sp. YIM B01966]
MRLPPTRGQCHAVFLLVHVAGLGVRQNRDQWVTAARQRSTIAALSFDLASAADALLDWGLAKSLPSIAVGHPLNQFGHAADYSSLKGIAGVLLRRRPPVWLRAAVVDGLLRRELVPSDDLNALAWLGDDLDDLLIAVHADALASSDDEFLGQLGRAGELIVMDALRAIGRPARHVALISDAFGYDIECGGQSKIEGLEVKTAFAKTSDRFFLSRNEFDISQRMSGRWHVVQVVLSSKVAASGIVTGGDVEMIRELPASTVRELAPADERHFRWLESAMFSPSEGQWISSALSVGQGFHFDLEAR